MCFRGGTEVLIIMSYFPDVHKMSKCLSAYFSLTPVGWNFMRVLCHSSETQTRNL